MRALNRRDDLRDNFHLVVNEGDAAQADWRLTAVGILLRED
jgi:hypothetical protein